MAVAQTTPRANPGSTTTPKRLSLADALKGGTNLPSRVLLHGQSGVGKSSFGGHAPSPFFLLSPRETGLHTLIDSGILPEIPNVEVQQWPDVLGVLDDLRTQDHQHKTLVIDTIDGVEKVANNHVLMTQYAGDMSENGFLGFYRGYKAVSLGPWRELLQSLDRLRTERRMGIILLAHTGLANKKNPSGSDYDYYQGEMYKEAWTQTVAWADVVLFANRDVAVSKDKGENRAKAQGAGERTLVTEWTPFADAKNRHNLPPEIAMGSSGKEAWDNFRAAMAAGRKNGRTE